MYVTEMNIICNCFLNPKDINQVLTDLQVSSNPILQKLFHRTDKMPSQINLNKSIIALFVKFDKLNLKFMWKKK